MEEGKRKALTEFLTLTNQHKEEIAPEEILKSLPIQNRTSQVPANARPLTIDQAEQPEENSLTESMTEHQKRCMECSQNSLSRLKSWHSAVR